MIKKHLMGFELAGLNKKENTILTVVWMIRIQAIWTIRLISYIWIGVWIILHVYNNQQLDNLSNKVMELVMIVGGAMVHYVWG